MSEKIQVQVDSSNNNLKFPNKSTLEKIIEYINFDSSNKYTLILNYATVKQPQQPVNRSSTQTGAGGTGGRMASKSPAAKKSGPRSSTSDMAGGGTATRKSSEKRKSSKPNTSLSDVNGVDVVTAGGSTNEILDHVLTKVSVSVVDVSMS